MTLKSAGTLAASSFITALVVWIRWLFEYFYKRVKRSPANESKISKAVVWFIRCALKALERFIRYTNRNAQVIASITGHNYCRSVGLAFKFELSHAATILVINTLGDLMLFLTKLFITALSTGLCYVLCRFASSNKNMTITPCLLTAGISYLVAFYIVEILELTIDVIFMAYVYETEMMLGERQNGQPSFAPGSLNKLLQEHDGTAGSKSKLASNVQ